MNLVVSNREAYHKSSSLPSDFSVPWFAIVIAILFLVGWAWACVVD